MKKWNKSFVPVYSSLETHLPNNVHLLTMETTNNNKDGNNSSGEEAITKKEKQIILRFENFYENYELDEVAEVNLDTLFKHLAITSLVEMNLSANQEISKKKMMDWMVEEGGEKKLKRFLKKQPADGSRAGATTGPVPDNDASQQVGRSIRLKPMEIRTFVVTANNK